MGRRRPDQRAGSAGTAATDKALRAPGDPLAFARSAVATLEMEHVAEELADPDCTELAAKRLRVCRQAARLLPAAAYGYEVIRVAAEDVEAASRRNAASTLRYRAARADDAGWPDEGRRLREQSLSLAPDRSHLTAVLLIELGRRTEACDVIDEVTGQNAMVMAELNVRAGRPARAREILTRAGALPPRPTWADLGRLAEIALTLGNVEESDRLAATAGGPSDPCGRMHPAGGEPWQALR